MSNNVYIYEGQGVDEICLTETVQLIARYYGKSYHLIQMDQSYLKREEAPLLYVFPGGRAVEMGWFVREAAEKVNQAVHQGAGFIGFCAGAMTGCSYWDHRLPELNWNSKDIHNALFKLGPTAEGPVFWDPADHNSHTYACAAMIDFKPLNQSFKCFWKQGPRLLSDAPHSIIAEYQVDGTKNPMIYGKDFPAVIASTYGKGKTVFLGVHPELAEWYNRDKYLLSSHDLEGNTQLFKHSFKLAGLN